MQTSFLLSVLEGHDFLVCGTQILLNCWPSISLSLSPHCLQQKPDRLYQHWRFYVLCTWVFKSVSSDFCHWQTSSGKQPYIPLSRKFQSMVSFLCCPQVVIGGALWQETRRKAEVARKEEGEKPEIIYTLQRPAISDQAQNQWPSSSCPTVSISQ